MSLCLVHLLLFRRLSPLGQMLGPLLFFGSMWQLLFLWGQGVRLLVVLGAVALFHHLSPLGQILVPLLSSGSVWQFLFL
jgi:hypothetical protein